MKLIQFYNTYDHDNPIHIEFSDYPKYQINEYVEFKGSLYKIMGITHMENGKIGITVINQIYNTATSRYSKVQYELILDNLYNVIMAQIELHNAMFPEYQSISIEEFLQHLECKYKTLSGENLSSENQIHPLL